MELNKKYEKASESIKIAKDLIDQEELQEAFDVAKKGMELAQNEPKLLYQFARVFENAEFIDEAIQGYKDVLKSEPKHMHARYHLALLLMDCGEIDAALEQLKELKKIDPQSPVTLELQLAIEVKQDDTEYAKTTEEKEEKKSQKPRLHQTAQAEIIDKRTTETFSADVLSNSQLKLVKFLFQGREGVYARQWIDKDGRSGYSPVYEKFDYQILKDHLAGKITLGVYLVMQNDRVCFMAVDVDINKKAVNYPSLNSVSTLIGD